MEYEKIIHGFIDDIVENKDALMITTLPNESEKDLTYLIVAEDNDIARLIGHKGSVAQALREVLSVAGTLEKKHIHLKFESLNAKDKDEK